MTVPAGGVLCLYTDGLVERRDRPIDDGIARLAAALTATDPETGCALVMGGMADYIPHDDDVALLLLRRTPVTASDREASDHDASARARVPVTAVKPLYRDVPHSLATPAARPRGRPVPDGRARAPAGR